MAELIVSDGAPQLWADQGDDWERVGFTVIDGLSWDSQTDSEWEGWDWSEQITTTVTGTISFAPGTFWFLFGETARWWRRRPDPRHRQTKAASAMHAAYRRRKR